MFVEVFGAYPQVKVIDLLLTHQNIEYTKEGETHLYTANMDCEAMRALKSFQYELAEIEIEEQMGFEQVVARSERKKEAVIA